MSYVLTLKLDPAAQAHFEALRQQWFPPERNLIPAHLTLFHTLPEEPWITQALEDAAAGTIAFALGTPTPKSIGRGAAFFFNSPEATALHKHLRKAFQAVVTPQDQQGFRPHIVAMNKATPAAAKLCLEALQTHRLPQEITATGSDLWRYLNGPWQHQQTFPFRKSETPTALSS